MILKSMKRNRRQEFSSCRVSFRGNVYCRLGSLFVSRQLMSRFIESKHLCQQIKPRFLCVHFILMNSKPLRENGRNRGSVEHLHMVMVTHGNGETERLSLVGSTDRCWLERSSCKRLLNK